MKIYQLDPKKFPRVQRNIILTYLGLALVGLFVVYLYIGQPLLGSAWTLIPFVLILFFLAGWYALRERKKIWKEYKLTLNQQTLTRSAPKASEVKLTKNDLIKIKEVRQGLILSTRAKENHLLIPKDLEDYQELKKRLETWTRQLESPHTP